MPKILIIDDERFIRASLREILEYEKFEVTEAQDGEEGLAKMQEEEFDLVLCDIKMPKMDGIEVLDQAKDGTISTVYHDIGAWQYRDSCRSYQKRCF
ncbi:response regulator [Algoriphagus boritolerans]|uniref:response regulator n=1 Tax=Algoriphagus boritolerans TaxID=308111 RepID=UPI003A0FDC75